MRVIFKAVLCFTALKRRQINNIILEQNSTIFVLAILLADWKLIQCKYCQLKYVVPDDSIIKIKFNFAKITQCIYKFRLKGMLYEPF